MTETFTKAEILEAIAIRPCHTSGEHDPNHHLTSRRVCREQASEAFDRLLGLLGVSEGELPRQLHDRCYWCHSPATGHKHAAWLAEEAALRD